MTYKAIFFTVLIIAALLGAVLLPHAPRITAQVDCNATPSDPSCQSSPGDNSQPPSDNSNPPADNGQPPQPSTKTCPDGSVIDASASCPTQPPPPPLNNNPPPSSDNNNPPPNNNNPPPSGSDNGNPSGNDKGSSTPQPGSVS